MAREAERRRALRRGSAGFAEIVQESTCCHPRSPICAGPIGCTLVNWNASMATDSKPVVHSDPEIMSGTPVFAGTRVPFQTLLDYIEAGQPLSEFLEDFPTVSKEHAVAALEQAKE